MTSRVLSVLVVFLASIFVGWNLIGTTEKVQAQPVIPSYLELMSMTKPQIKEKSSVSIDTINIAVDVNTQEVSVKGTTDAIVNVKTTNEPKPIVKYRTVVKEIEAKSTGYPYVNSVGKVPEGTAPISPLKTISSNHE